MFRALGLLLTSLLLVACKPAQISYHELMMNPEAVSQILLRCERDPSSALCPEARRARRETQALLIQLRRSPEDFGLHIMSAQSALSQLQQVNATDDLIQAQQQKIKELQFITELAGM